jgi:hypothetical protein
VTDETDFQWYTSINPTMSPSASQPSGLEITSRDIEMLRGLFECRVMTVEQVSTLFFDDRLEAARKRIWKLKTAGLVRERPRRAYEPSVLLLTTSALRILLRDGHVEDYPRLNLTALQKRARVSPLTLRHELDVIDARAAFTKAIRAKPHLTLNEFSTWPRMFEFETHVGGRGPIKIKPDGFVRIQTGEVEHHLFLEVDRSTERLEALCQRIRGYLNFYRVGAYATRRGYSKERYKEFPFRVMLIFRNRERRNNVAARLIANVPPILTMALMTTMAELRNNPLDSIWVRPLDYRRVLSNTLYDTNLASKDRVYRRTMHRENFVEEHILKQSLP